MRRLMTCLVLVAAAAVSSASDAPSPRSPEQVVRAYTRAANAGDLEAFLALYAPTIRKYRFPGELASEGLAHNREVYTRAFASYPDLEVEIVELIALGEMVVVHDRVTGRADGRTAEEITVYEVEDGLITRIEYVKQAIH